MNELIDLLGAEADGVTLKLEPVYVEGYDESSTYAHKVRYYEYTVTAGGRTYRAESLGDAIFLARHGEDDEC